MECRHGAPGRAPAACENCGRDDDDLSPVHRVYLLPEEHRLEGIEWWCVSCRTQYPHDDPA